MTTTEAHAAAAAAGDDQLLQRAADRMATDMTVVIPEYLALARAAHDQIYAPELARLRAEARTANQSYEALSGHFHDAQLALAHEREQLRAADDEIDRLNAELDILRGRTPAGQTVTLRLESGKTVTGPLRVADSRRVVNGWLVDVTGRTLLVEPRIGGEGRG